MRLQVKEQQWCLAIPEAGRADETSPRTSKVSSACPHLSFRLWPPELGENTFLLFEASPVLAHVEMSVVAITIVVTAINLAVEHF